MNVDNFASWLTHSHCPDRAYYINFKFSYYERKKINSNCRGS